MKTLALALAALPLVAAATGPSPWSGNTLWAAVNGLDSPTCGAPQNPCRSISQAIANAAEGDTIVVRPGKYGDLNDDGALGAPGEESGRFIGVIEIAKRVRVISSDGATVTVIDANEINSAAVFIQASGVQFGERGAGFTLAGARSTGVQIETQGNVVVAGNTIRGVARNQDFGQALYINFSTVVEVRDNQLIDNAVGIVLFSQNATAYGSVHDNVISGSNRTWGSTGISASGAGPHLIYRNLLSDNSIGLTVEYGAARVYNNVITGGRDGANVYAFGTVPPRGPTFVRNTFSANSNYGLYVIVGTPGALTIRENNFFGNISNCGIASQSADAIEARNNYWGAATGPSAVDPADEACAFQGSINTTPFATREFTVR